MPEFTEDLWYLNDWSRRRIKDADEQWLASCKVAARQILGPGETLYEDSVGDNGHTTDVLNELVETIARREWYQVSGLQHRTAQDHVSPLRFSARDEEDDIWLEGVKVPKTVKTILPFIREAISRPTEIYRLRLQEITSSYNEQVDKCLFGSTSTGVAGDRSGQRASGTSNANGTAPAGDVVHIIDD